MMQRFRIQGPEMVFGRRKIKTVRDRTVACAKVKIRVLTNSCDKKKKENGNREGGEYHGES
jgi:hypothetical protein